MTGPPAEQNLPPRVAAAVNAAMDALSCGDSQDEAWQEACRTYGDDPALPVPHLPAENAEWQCPTGVLHLYEVVIDDHCVAAIKRLTEHPEQNLGDLMVFAKDYLMRDGTKMAGFAPRPGELLRVACAKCGREAIVGIGWSPGA